VARKKDVHKVDSVKLCVGDALIKPQHVVKNLAWGPAWLWALNETTRERCGQACWLPLASHHPHQAAPHHLSMCECHSRGGGHMIPFRFSQRLATGGSEIAAEEAADCAEQCCPCANQNSRERSHAFTAFRSKSVLNTKLSAQCTIHNPDAPQFLRARDMCWLCAASTYPARLLRSADQSELNIARTRSQCPWRKSVQCSASLSCFTPGAARPKRRFIFPKTFENIFVPWSLWF
jgi:hypothetical protein